MCLYPLLSSNFQILTLPVERKPPKRHKLSGKCSFHHLDWHRPVLWRLDSSAVLSLGEVSSPFSGPERDGTVLRCTRLLLDQALSLLCVSCSLEAQFLKTDHHLLLRTDACRLPPGRFSASLHSAAASVSPFPSTLFASLLGTWIFSSSPSLWRGLSFPPTLASQMHISLSWTTISHHYGIFYSMTFNPLISLPNSKSLSLCLLPAIIQWKWQVDSRDYFW